jgi:hypothetical protein
MKEREREKEDKDRDILWEHHSAKYSYMLFIKPLIILLRFLMGW